MRRRNIALSSLFLTSVLLASCGGGDSAAGGKSYCEVVKAADKSAKLNTVFEGDEPPTQADIDVVATVFSDMAATAPTGIKTELGEIRDFMKNDLSIMVGLDTKTTDPAELAKMMEKMAPIMTRMEGLEAKMEKVAATTKTECGIDLNA